jgi:hypothetical protein
MIHSVVVSDIEKYLDQLPIGNPWKNAQNVNILLPNLINLILVISVTVCFFILLLGGLQWITSGGDKDSLTKAKGKITSALVGIAIVFSAWIILGLVKHFFSLD